MSTRATKTSSQRNDDMFSKRIAAIFATCAALASCDVSTPVRNVTAPPPGPRSFDATASQAQPTPYDLQGTLLEESGISARAVAPQAAATGGRASGHFELAAPILNRAAEQYSFIALSTASDGSAKGQVELHTSFTFGADADVHIEVDCLAVAGNEAWFSGPAKRYTLAGVPQPPGLYLIFRVQDNGEGSDDPPDMGSPAFSSPPQGCRLQPPLLMTPTANGNIQVRQR